MKIMLQGTASSVGKSILTTALCRIFAQDGFKVAPFKAQNMALNSYITKDGGEMGRAQAIQAEAAVTAPDVLMNPVLLKPTSDRRSQVIILGKAIGDMSAVEYHEYKPQLAETVKSAYEKLAAKNDIIVIEGAGSPAEINLRDKDIVNMGFAEMIEAPVLLIGDIDRGGVFAHIAGTIQLLREEERKRVKGFIINKFRGDISLLQSGLTMLEEITSIPSMGVVPMTKVNIEDEDSLSERLIRKNVSGNGDVRIEIIKGPHISNFTDFTSLETVQDVEIEYITDPAQSKNPDLIILPGSKNTVGDLEYMRKSGLDALIKNHAQSGKLVIGICGGYQILGEKILDPYGIETSNPIVNGLELLNTETTMEKTKITVQSHGVLKYSEFEGMEVDGYEIHMGRTVLKDGATPFLINSTKETDGAVNKTGNVFGTYFHGLFDNNNFTKRIIGKIRKSKGLPEIDLQMDDYILYKETQYNILANAVRQSLDIDRIYKIMKQSER